MSQILDASGRPLATRELTDQQLLGAFQQLDARLQGLSQQVVHLGLFTEFLYEQIGAATNDDGSPLITINMDEFKSWAEVRYREIQNDVEAALQQMPENQQATSAIDLDETING